MIHLFPAFLIGMFVAWFVFRRRLRDLESDKENLLDFNEQQQRVIEALQERETQLSLRLFYAEHPELNEEEWPTEISFQ